MAEQFQSPSALAQRRRQQAIERLNQDYQAEHEQSLAATTSRGNDGIPGYIAADGRYVPNRIALKKRIVHSLLSLGIVAYGYWGVQRDDLVVPLSKRVTSHFHQLSAWIMYAAMLCAAVHCVSMVIDHYDRRNNEHLYLRIGDFSKSLAWWLFVIAFVVGLQRHQIDFR